MNHRIVPFLAYDRHDPTLDASDAVSVDPQAMADSDCDGSLSMTLRNLHTAQPADGRPDRSQCRP